MTAMNVTFWFLIAFGGTATPIDIVERFTTEHYCESVRKAMPSAQQAMPSAQQAMPSAQQAMPSAQQAIAKCVQATVAR